MDDKDSSIEIEEKLKDMISNISIVDLIQYIRSIELPDTNELVNVEIPSHIMDLDINCIPIPELSWIE